jgi:Fe-S cluster assembly protein SufD
MNIVNSFETYLGKIKPLNQVKNWDLFIKSKELLKESLLSQGLPKRTEESWKYTSVKFLNDMTFQHEITQEENLSEKIKDEIKAKLLSNFHNIVFVNGVLLKSLSRYDEAQIELSIQSLEQPLTEDKTTSWDTKESKSSFSFTPALTMINELYTLTKSIIKIKQNSNVEKPIQVLSYTISQNDLSLNSNPNVEIFVEKHARATLLYTMQGPAGVKYFTNAKLKIFLSENSKLELVNETKQSFQSYHFDQNLVNLSKDSQLTYLDYNLSSLLSRHELVVNLSAPGAVAKVFGASLLQKTEHCDQQTKIHFKASNTEAEQLYKNILDDESHAVFSGTVYIDPNIEAVNSAQLNNNLLLSDKAEANSKPILMIYSDDVKASHGSTVGQLNNEELFYLQSRAISKERAKELLSAGFLLELVEKLESNALKKYLQEELEQKFIKTKQRPSIRNLK